MMRERWIWKGIALNCLHFAGAPLLPKKCSCISAAFRRIIALFIAFVRPSPGGISRASSRTATALMFSSSATDDWVRFIGANELFARTDGGGGRRGGLPLNKHRSGDQQHKKDRQQYRGHRPLANTEFVDI